MLMQMAYVGDNYSNLSSNLGLSVILPESYLGHISFYGRKRDAFS